MLDSCLPCLTRSGYISTANARIWQLFAREDKRHEASVSGVTTAVADIPSACASAAVRRSNGNLRASACNRCTASLDRSRVQRGARGKRCGLLFKIAVGSSHQTLRTVSCQLWSRLLPPPKVVRACCQGWSCLAFCVLLLASSWGQAYADICASLGACI